MRKTLIALALALTAGVAPMTVSAAYAEDAPAAHYSVDTTLCGKLIDDPAAAAILKELIPTVWENDMFQSMGRDQTLRSIQQFEPAVLTDEKLAEIQAAFDKIPVRD